MGQDIINCYCESGNILHCMQTLCSFTFEEMCQESHHYIILAELAKP